MAEVRVEEYKGKFRFTIPRLELRKIQAKTDDYIKVILNKNNKICTYYGRIPNIPKCRTNLQTKKGVPKDYAKQINLKKGDFINLKISKVDNVKSDILIRGGYLDVLNNIPIKTNSNKTIMVEEFLRNNENWLKVWYCSGHGGKSKEIELKRFVKIDKKLGEFFGLMQAEGGKKNKFTFTNKFISEHKLFIDITKSFGISEDMWNYIIYHKPNINNDSLKNFLKTFKNTFCINKPITITKNKNLIDVIYGIYINSKLLNLIMVNMLIKMRSSLLYIPNKTTSKSLKEFAEGFIIKDLIGDGTVIVNEANRQLSVIISEQDKKAQKDIVNILKMLNIEARVDGIKIYLSTKFENCLWLLKNKVFKEHKYNRKKLVSYMINNYYFNCLYNRLNKFNIYSIKSFSKLHKLPYNTAEMYLYRNFLRGYLNRYKKRNKSLYITTKKCEEMINIFEDTKKELLTFDAC
ncbi:MAG: hypothetical protein KJ623_02000 [Nanoarchaeota archaeon]|nr:hypothetical protein [Nanoarchaeota archaeon]MBU0963387.1 hypothetical protein [Nanoarchaeota archaeon]